MRVPVSLSEGFGKDFEARLTQFVVDQELIPEENALESPRFLARSVVPHVRKLSDLFNRRESAKPTQAEPQGKGAKPGKGGKTSGKPSKDDKATNLDPYWQEGSNPANLRLAYFLAFMPPNLFRMASVWSELARLGFKWDSKLPLRAVEFGAGPATATVGIAAGEFFTPLGLPTEGNFALIEQDLATLGMGAEWAENSFGAYEKPNWGIRKFHRKLDLKLPLLPKTAPTFSLWITSFFLNELAESPKAVAEKLFESWEKHLEREGLVILVEPALKVQSRKLLETRKVLLENPKFQENYRILLPCLGHQACGALAKEDDWCHEEVMWWRPAFLKRIDEACGLDRKTLPFSYLVIQKTKRSLEEILPGIQNRKNGAARYRLVSPAHQPFAGGKDVEFYICGQDGKRRARAHKTDPKLERGDILLDAYVRGDHEASRVESYEAGP